ncbi:hypothetical protein CPB84DRAFT_1779611 [Gymnopilus junonius]|uniref:Uncharacterized protein n=1 Tax=Gymnopilus junonius TaxID=109634 RepID=A0A9P5TLW3_GYMJU|nr:hypothetical protein CPB84DRAFT_1779611 [Gymnopilus junonius]
MNMPLDPPRVHKRAQLPPLPRKATASPVRLGPNLARLEIGGTWNRSPPTSHVHPKPLPPSVVVQEWGSKGVDTSSSTQPHPRPLPSVPGNTADPGKHTSNTIAGPPRIVGAAMPLAGSSRNVNAVAGPSKQANAAAGPSKHPNALNTSPAQVSPPASKVLITQPTPQRAHRQNSPSFSMRYQALVAEPSTIAPTEEATAPPASTANISSPIRPLPRIPLPNTSAVILRQEPTPALSSRKTSGASIKRPRTSPSSISGFSVPGSSNLPLSRSPFDNITSSWAAKPVDLHALRTQSPPLPLSPGTRPPRARSHSRPRRDRSLDSYYSSPKSSKSSSMYTGHSSGARTLRSLPSPTIGGARPLPKKASTMDQFPLASKPLRIQTTNVGLSSGTSGTSRRLFSPFGKRSEPPSPPSGPVKPRSKASPIPSPVIHAPIPTSRSLPTPHTETLQISPAHSSPEQEEFSAANETITIDTQSTDAPLHSHPKEAFVDNESLLHPTSPSTAESPIEVFIDDKDLSTLSRSPSPIRYARPDSRGNLSESDDDDVPSSSSSSMSPSSSPERRRRTQLRSYRHSYRPRAGTSPPHIPFRPPSPSPVLELPTPVSGMPTPVLATDRKKKEGRKTRSYFGAPAPGSAPTTRASSPERKSRSRQPRRLAEAVTSALEEVRNRGRGPSSSPKRKLKSASGSAAGSAIGTPGLAAPVEMEVLDISLPSLSGRETTATVDTGSSHSDTVPPATSSGRSSLKGGWAKTMVKKRSEIGDYNGDSESGTVAHLSSMVTGVELDGAETPYMWVSASKPPVAHAPFLPPPPQPRHSHRRTDSLEDYALLKHPAESGETDRHGVSCGVVTGGRPRIAETIITSTVTVSRPPSAPFSPFSLTNLASNKNRKKRTTSLTTSRTTTDERDPPLIVRKEQEGDEIDWLEDEKRSDHQPELEGEVVVVTTKRVMRSIDHDGIWEHEQETGVADVIPHLRNLKASKS